MTSAGASAEIVCSWLVGGRVDLPSRSVVWATGIFQFSSDPSERLFGQCFHIPALSALEELGECRGQELGPSAIRIRLQTVPVAVSDAE